MQNQEVRNSYKDYRNLDGMSMEALLNYTELHHYLEELSKQKGLITYNNQLRDDYCINIKNIEDRNKGNMVSYSMALESIRELRRNGVILPKCMARTYENELVTSYLLSTCMCYVEVDTGARLEYFLATKNLKIFDEFLQSNSYNTDINTVIELNEELETSEAEISSGVFKVIGIYSVCGECRVISKEFDCKSRRITITPVYWIKGYIENLTKLLRDYKVIIMYEDDDKLTKGIATTLNHEYLVEYWGKDIESVEFGLPIPTLELSKISIPNLLDPQHKLEEINIYKIKLVQAVR